MPRASGAIPSPAPRSEGSGHAPRRHRDAPRAAFRSARGRGLALHHQRRHARDLVRADAAAASAGAARGRRAAVRLSRRLQPRHRAAQRRADQLRAAARAGRRLRPAAHRDRDAQGPGRAAALEHPPQRSQRCHAAQPRRRSAHRRDRGVPAHARPGAFLVDLAQTAARGSLRRGRADALFAAQSRRAAPRARDRRRHHHQAPDRRRRAHARAARSRLPAGAARAAGGGFHHARADLPAAEPAAAQALRLFAGRADRDDRQHRAQAPAASARLLHRRQRAGGADRHARELDAAADQGIPAILGRAGRAARRQSGAASPRQVRAGRRRQDFHPDARRRAQGRLRRVAGAHRLLRLLDLAARLPGADEPRDRGDGAAGGAQRGAGADPELGEAAHRPRAHHRVRRARPRILLARRARDRSAAGGERGADLRHQRHQDGERGEERARPRPGRRRRRGPGVHRIRPGAAGEGGRRRYARTGAARGACVDARQIQRRPAARRGRQMDERRRRLAAANRGNRRRQPERCGRHIASGARWARDVLARPQLPSRPEGPRRTHRQR